MGAHDDEMLAALHALRDFDSAEACRLVTVFVEGDGPQDLRSRRFVFTAAKDHTGGRWTCTALDIESGGGAVLEMRSCKRQYARPMWLTELDGKTREVYLQMQVRLDFLSEEAAVEAVGCR